MLNVCNSAKHGSIAFLSEELTCPVCKEFDRNRREMKVLMNDLAAAQEKLIRLAHARSPVPRTRYEDGTEIIHDMGQ